MGITFVNKTFSLIGSSTSVTPTEPTNTVQHDVMFMWIGLNGPAADSLVPPAGWALIYDNWNAAQNLSCWLYWLRRGASAPAYGISWTGAFYNEVSITSWRGASRFNNPYNASATTGALQNANPSVPNCPAVTTTIPNTEVIAFGGSWGTTTGFTAPSGYNIREANIATGALCVASKAVAAAGTENPAAFGGATGLANVQEVTVALAPDRFILGGH